jgi:MYXO-CTERM domain-containing protein
MTTPVNSDDDDGDEGKWGLLGLLGLAGLLGLKRRDHDNRIHSNDRR